MGRQRSRSQTGQSDGATREATRRIESLGRLQEWDAADLVDRANSIGKELSQKRMTTSQIRNFLDEVNRIHAETQGGRGEFSSSRVILLKPLLAYAAGRETGERRDLLRSFADLFSAAADKVQDAADFKQFVDFTRAVVAYHRYYGGSNQ